MKLIFELGVEGRGMTLMPECDVPEYQLPEERSEALHLPHVSENELTRHYTALCKRKECVDRPLTCGKKNVGGELSFVRSAHTNRPFCTHINLNIALVCFENGNCFVNCKIALADAFNDTACFVRNKNPVKNSVCFLNSTECVACRNCVALFNKGSKVPLLFVIK